VSRLILVRHAAVELDPDRPAPEWRLTAEGRKAAEELSRSQDWSRVTVVASSPEPKARDTANPIALAAGLPLRIENDLREAERGSLPILSREEYVALVRRYLSGEPVGGWEPTGSARGRFAACVERLLAEAGGDVVAGSHGLVISLYLGLSIEQWETLPLPALIEA
jgi:broad specificity phosphatase PhoE